MDIQSFPCAVFNLEYDEWRDIVVPVYMTTHQPIVVWLDEYLNDNEIQGVKNDKLTLLLQEAFNNGHVLAILRRIY